MTKTELSRAFAKLGLTPLQVKALCHVLILRKTHAEAAKSMRVGTETIKSLIFRARKKCPQLITAFPRRHMRNLFPQSERTPPEAELAEDQAA